MCFEQKSRSKIISFPAVAYNTYQRLKGSRIFRKIVEYTSHKLAKISNPISRANFVHKHIQKYNDEVLKDPVVKKYLSCKMGCSACCHSQVGVTYEEATLLADLVKEGLEIDINKLHKQKDSCSSAKDWFQQPYEQRGCVFLSGDGLCRVYENRPAVCRTNYVISDPALCDTSDGKEKPIRLLNTFKSDMVVYAAFKESKKTGAMPIMLWESLSEIGKTPVIISNPGNSKNNSL